MPFYCFLVERIERTEDTEVKCDLWRICREIFNADDRDLRFEFRFDLH